MSEDLKYLYGTQEMLRSSMAQAGAAKFNSGVSWLSKQKIELAAFLLLSAWNDVDRLIWRGKQNEPTSK